MSPTMDFRDANTAGSPLPLLPRRSPSANRTTFPSTSTATPKAASPPIKLVVQHATPPDDPAEASSSSVSSSDDRPVTIRPKRVRGVRPQDQNTPTPTPFPTRRQSPSRPRSDSDDGNTTPRPSARPLVYAPGAGIGLRALSTSHIPAPPPSLSPPKSTEETPRMVRKKSGQPVKSSLKSSTPKVRGSLAVVIGGGSSKSAPTTPTTRPSVHFDAQLEHVKLFLAEQKPLAVSRDGSPTDDTSGTEGDFPNWIFGREEQQGRLEMLVNVPLPPHELDVKLQALTLSDDGTSVTGTVAVRNLAFDKWVAVRFTFDDWQTTSEVTARYAHSMPGGAVDVFSFSIRLNDLLARIEGKVMVLAVRYTSAGREMWDNNGGGNYRATFKRVRGETKKEEESRTKATATAKPKGPEGEVVADLRSRLEHVVKAQEGLSGPVQLRAAAKIAAETADKFKAGWLARGARAASHPVGGGDSPSPPSTIPWPKQHQQLHRAKPVLGSPRDAAEDAGEFRPAPYIASDSEDAPFTIAPAHGQRHHQRGYFDVPLRHVSALRRTPPGTPRALDDLTPMPTPSRFNSFPPLDPRIGMGLNFGMAIGLDEGRLTPREVARGGELERGEHAEFCGQSGVVQERDSVACESPGLCGTWIGDADRREPGDVPFLPGQALAIEGLPRTQSVSSVEEFLSAASASPRLHTYVSKQLASPAPAPLRFDDSRSSGSTTPTTIFAPTTSESRSTAPAAA
ncbi:CBM21 domain-containing protein [Mycena venus]|uniref:CBM21 domain-containing protein n=1 Tax=Mycena venus TaxID=2733690 RepID=A0A8H6Y7D4_9AGAR|nr:CBM21 domain-containing protein [Mycena venus]